MDVMDTLQRDRETIQRMRGRVRSGEEGRGGDRREEEKGGGRSREEGIGGRREEEKGGGRREERKGEEWGGEGRGGSYQVVWEVWQKYTCVAFVS